MSDALHVTFAMSVLIVGPTYHSANSTPEQTWPLSAASAADDLLIEAGSSDDVRYFRVTPKNQISIH